MATEDNIPNNLDPVKPTEPKENSIPNNLGIIIPSVPKEESIPNNLGTVMPGLAKEESIPTQISLPGSCDSKNNNWAQTTLATLSSIAPVKNIILSFKSLE